MTALTEHVGTGTALPWPYRVVARRVETRDTVTIELASDDTPVEAFGPGQFAMLTAYGIGDVPISLSAGGAGGAGGGRAARLTHTLRAVGAVTTALHGSAPGAVIGVRGPFGTGWDVAAAAGRDVVIVAGGIGLAPLRPVVAEMVARRRRYQRVSLLVGARTPDDLIYTGELPRWAAAGIDVAVTVDRPDDAWTGHVGVVPALLPAALPDPAGTVAFVCGPEIMMRFTAAALLDRGVDACRIQVSLERNMRCGVGWCGHCQLGPLLLCRDGPVVDYARAEPLMRIREL